MSTFLFDTIIFGPVWSRRLGESLGINLLPVNNKVCTFNCIYCECGLTPSGGPSCEFPGAGEVISLLEQKLRRMVENGEYLDSITFAGNGEPTLHPEFSKIMDDAIGIRDLYFPNARIAVLSNATRIGNDGIFNALMKADLNILKLDSGIEKTLDHINCPKNRVHLAELLQLLKRFNGKVVIQTLFLRGTYNGIFVDNTTDKEVDAWIEALKIIGPEHVMIYSIARDTAVKGIERVSQEKLETIARRVEKEGISTQVTP